MLNTGTENEKRSVSLNGFLWITLSPFCLTDLTIVYDEQDHFFCQQARSYIISSIIMLPVVHGYIKNITKFFFWWLLVELKKRKKKLVIRILTMFDVVDTSFFLSTIIFFSEKKILKSRTRKQKKNFSNIPIYTIGLAHFHVYFFVLAFFPTVFWFILPKNTKRKWREMARHDDYWER